MTQQQQIKAELKNRFNDLEKLNERFDSTLASMKDILGETSDAVETIETTFFESMQNAMNALDLALTQIEEAE